MSTELELTPRGEIIARTLNDVTSQFDFTPEMIYPDEDTFPHTQVDTTGDFWTIANDVLIMVGGYYDEFDCDGHDPIDALKRRLSEGDGYDHSEIDFEKLWQTLFEQGMITQKEATNDRYPAR